MRKFLIGASCLLFLALAFPVLAKEQPGKPETTPPDLEKITFIHYAKSAKNSKPVWDDTVDKFKFIAGGIRWADTMTYEVNPYGSYLNENEVIATLSESLETWDIETSFELFATPELDDSVSFNENRDYTNTVTWGSLGSGIIAVNQFWYNPALKIIVESDVVFSTGFTWSLAGESGKMDLQNIATHEFGHNGLSDLYMPPSTALTMYGYSGYGEIDKQTLGTGDWLGIQELYNE
ncbi:MAG TPA: matrixin family metalloprotease [Patescibacteria group bacterium]|nr:matrixin family metalloprotease [Patescibacteria group bacterium]